MRDVLNEKTGKQAMNRDRSVSSIIKTENEEYRNNSNDYSSIIVASDDEISTKSKVTINSKSIKIDGKTLNNRANAQALDKQQLVDAEQVFKFRDNYCFHKQNQKADIVKENCSRLSNKQTSVLGRKKEEARSTDNVDYSHVESEEKDVDSGYAWIILAVMFVINASTFGTARAYGLIFEKLAREHNNARTEAALPFTIMGALENMGGPLTGYLLTKTNSWRLTVFIGSFLITLAHILAAFCTTLNSLILTMGLMCGLGLSFVTISSFQINNAYFNRYRSRAFGLGLTGAVFGTFYISPICQHVLESSSTTSECYLMLGLILTPNLPLSLLLKPKTRAKMSKNPTESNGCNYTNATIKQFRRKNIVTISEQINKKEEQPGQFIANESPVWLNIIRVIQTPIFHLIWPTQLLFCWFNFVFGMIIVDFSKDRGLDCTHGAQLITIWAFGQLTGRTILGSFVDLKLVSYKLFTVICFISISLSTWILNNIRPNNHQYQEVLISSIVFILSMFISNLYILFNGLIVNYMEKSLAPLSLGISSFTSSFFLLPRANVIGYYRDTIGNYDSMLTLFTYISLIAAIVWLLVPELFERLKVRKFEQKSYNYKYNHYIYLWFKSYSLSSITCSSIRKLPHNSNLSQKSLYSSQEGRAPKEQTTNIVGPEHNNKIPVIEDLV